MGKKKTRKVFMRKVSCFLTGVIFIVIAVYLFVEMV